MRVLRATLPGTGNAYLPPGSGRSCGEPELRRAVATRAKEWADVRRLEVRANPHRNVASATRPNRQSAEGMPRKRHRGGLQLVSSKGENRCRKCQTQ